LPAAVALDPEPGEVEVAVVPTLVVVLGTIDELVMMAPFLMVDVFEQEEDLGMG